MIQNWMKPVDVHEILDGKEASPRHISGQMLIYEKSVPNLANTSVVLLGTDDFSANAIRKALYQYTFPFKNLKIADIGNLRQFKHEGLLAVLTELLSSGLTPVVLGGTSPQAQTLMIAQAKHRQLANYGMVTPHLDFETSETYLKSHLEKYPKSILNLIILGYQSYLAVPQALAFMEKHHFDHVRLGDMRADWEATEAALRDADGLAFDVGALRAADAPAKLNPSPSGLYTEEACRLTRYAGMSDKLSSLGIFGYAPEQDTSSQTAHVVAQMIWYFLDGFHNRKNDYPVSNEGLTEYIVPLQAQKRPLTFWKSNKSGRWWVELTTKSNQSPKLERHRLVPCTYADYQMALKGSVPDCYLNALARLG
jgi:formiminoglutamase